LLLQKTKYEQAFLEKRKEALEREMHQDQVALESYDEKVIEIQTQ
jgi:hypothetical protein